MSFPEQVKANLLDIISEMATHKDDFSKHPGTDNVHWWHRIIERKDFRVNGYFNHYPDFMVKTKSGKLVLIEAKGDYLDGDDSKKKLILGRKWQELAGRMYRYFMVFKKKNLKWKVPIPWISLLI